MRWPDEPGFTAAVHSVLDAGASTVEINLKNHRTHDADATLGVELRTFGFELGPVSPASPVAKVRQHATFPSAGRRMVNTAARLLSVATAEGARPGAGRRRCPHTRASVIVDEMVASLGTILSSARRAYRASGADHPYGDPLPAHGVAMEGYFWRLSDPASGRVVIALAGVNQSAEGPWATLGLAAHPNGFLRTLAHPGAHADDAALGVSAGKAFRGTGRTLDVDLGPDALLQVTLTTATPWPRRSFGGSSVFQSVPGLNQYWHPWLLGGRAHGRVVLGEETWEIDGWSVYAEKNWGKGGFPDSWWWGQAHGFDDPGVCVAFAGGQVSAGPLRTTVTAVVVRLPDGTVLRLGDPVLSPVRAEVSDERWSLDGHSPRWAVTVEGWGTLATAHVLPVPLPAEHRNVPGAIEHLGARMHVSVRRRGHGGGRAVWEGTSHVAALEHGSVSRAQSELARRGANPTAVDAPPLQA